MTTIMRHELFKLQHQKIIVGSLLVLLLLILYSAFPLAFITKNLVAQGFGLSQWTIIIIIALSSNSITMEYRDKTMPTLLYKSPNRAVPYFAKLFTLILLGLILTISGIIFSLILQPILASRYSWSVTLYHPSLMTVFWANVGGGTLYLLFAITLSLCLVSLCRSNAVVIIVGLIIGFLGANLSAALMKALPGARSVLAWNPLNMINVIQPFANNMKLVGLTVPQLVIGNLIYSIIFLLVGLWAFKRARV